MVTVTNEISIGIPATVIIKKEEIDVLTQASERSFSCTLDANRGYKSNEKVKFKSKKEFPLWVMVDLE